LRDPRAIIHEMRLFKEPQEIEIMRRAASISGEAHQAAARLAHPGASEHELDATLHYTFRRLGAEGPAYPSIVASGSNATVLHYTANNQPLREGELVLIDAGCELESYASDVTRTYPIGGRFGAEARALYEIVLTAQEAALEIARPGSTLDDLHSVTLRSLTEGMLELGVLEGRPEELVENAAYRRYYMHRTSHWLGLDVHDVGSYTLEGKPRTLCAGMVFTVEPGIYVPADDDVAAPRFRGIGVRIEDDVRITETGHENLTQTIPKKPEDVEAWVRGA
jgi:Xaa-Pro aminopeptidase